MLGKVTPLMMLVIAGMLSTADLFYSAETFLVIEPIFYWINVHIGLVRLKVFDIGGGI